MKLEAVASIVRGIPFTNDDRLSILHEFILHHKPTECLELGVAFGKATCCIAAALEELGRGKVIGVDLAARRAERIPSPESLIDRCGLSEYTALAYEEVSYNWFLMKLIRAQSTKGSCKPCLDFCFLDGAHDWYTDGLAFFLVEKLLKPGGWVIFDDVHWTFGTSPTLSASPSVAKMPEEERTTPQVGLILELLVAQHPNFAEVFEDGTWGYARKHDYDSVRRPLEGT